jgi:hypothetical protein
MAAKIRFTFTDGTSVIDNPYVDSGCTRTMERVALLGTIAQVHDGSLILGGNSVFLASSAKHLRQVEFSHNWGASQLGSASFEFYGFEV